MLTANHPTAVKHSGILRAMIAAFAILLAAPVCADLPPDLAVHVMNCFNYQSLGQLKFYAFNASDIGRAIPSDTQCVKYKTEAWLHCSPLESGCQIGWSTCSDSVVLHISGSATKDPLYYRKYGQAVSETFPRSFCP